VGGIASAAAALTGTKAATTSPTPSRISAAYASFPCHDLLKVVIGADGGDGGGGGAGVGVGARFSSLAGASRALFCSSSRVLLLSVLRSGADCHAG